MVVGSEGCSVSAGWGTSGWYDNKSCRPPTMRDTGTTQCTPYVQTLNVTACRYCTRDDVNTRNDRRRDRDHRPDNMSVVVVVVAVVPGVAGGPRPQWRQRLPVALTAHQWHARAFRTDRQVRHAVLAGLSSWWRRDRCMLRWICQDQDGRGQGSGPVRRRRNAVPERWRHVPGHGVLHVSQVAVRGPNDPAARPWRYGKYPRVILYILSYTTRSSRDPQRVIGQESTSIIFLLQGTKSFFR